MGKLLNQEVEIKMNKKEMIRFTIGGLCIILLVIVSWRVFTEPNKVEALMKEDVQKIVQDRFKGEITKTELKDDVYTVSFQLATGHYDARVSKVDGEILSVAQTKQEEKIYNLSESVIRQIIKQEAPGTIESLTKKTTDKVDQYAAIVLKDGKETHLTIDGETGEVLRKDLVDATTGKKPETDDKQVTKSDTKQETAESKQDSKELSLKGTAAPKAQEQVQQEDQKQAGVKEPKETTTKQTKQEDQKKAEAKKAEAPKNEAKKTEAKKPKETKKKETATRKLSEKEAIQIALKKVQGVVDDVDYEVEGGQPYYFIEIETADDKEYEFQIHAITGKIRSMVIDD